MARLSAGRNFSTYGGPPSIICLRSTPAEKDRPRPVRTTARASATAARLPGTALSRSRSSAFTGPLSRVRTAMPSWSAVSIIRQSYDYRRWFGSGQAAAGPPGARPCVRRLDGDVVVGGPGVGGGHCRGDGGGFEAFDDQPDAQG